MVVRFGYEPGKGSCHVVRHCIPWFKLSVNMCMTDLHFYILTSISLSSSLWTFFTTLQRCIFQGSSTCCTSGFLQRQRLEWTCVTLFRLFDHHVVHVHLYHVPYLIFVDFVHHSLISIVSIIETGRY
jgi:hypothetical protein